MSKRIPNIVIANWKMNGLLAPSMREFKKIRDFFLQDLISCDVVICPPFTLLRDMAEKLPNTGIKIGGQNASYAEHGAFTGEISAFMLADLMCEYVILGHSERRALFHETSEVVNKKATTAHKAKLKSIICVGETMEERDGGIANEVIETQLLESIPDSANDSNTIIAYEPIWAIGSNVTPSLDEINEMHTYIKSFVDKRIKSFGNPPRIVYGGSVGANNAKEIVNLHNVNGLLVGRASLDADSFCNIVQSAS